MRLLEYEAKQLLVEAGLAIPRELVTGSAAEAGEFARSLGVPVVLKAQVPVGGRMKAGGVLFAADAAATELVAQSLLGMSIRGYAVEKISVQEQIGFDGSLYLAATIDASTRQATLIASTSGGIEIESATDIVRQAFSLRQPYPTFRARELAAKLLASPTWKVGQEAMRGAALTALTDIVQKLARFFQRSDALLVEVNPLLYTGNPTGLFVVVDAHIELDDDALYRHSAVVQRFGLVGRGERPRTALEQRAAEIDGADHRGVAGRVVEFDGDLALLIGGGGASLTIFDAILDAGGRPANYCEIGGNPSVWKVSELTKLLLDKPGVKRLAVIMNVVNNTRVDLVARGVVKGILESGCDPARVIAAFRIPGSWEEEGRKILEKYGVPYYGREHSLNDVAGRVAALPSW